MENISVSSVLLPVASDHIDMSSRVDAMFSVSRGPFEQTETPLPFLLFHTACLVVYDNSSSELLLNTLRGKGMLRYRFTNIIMHQTQKHKTPILWFPTYSICICLTFAQQ